MCRLREIVALLRRFVSAQDLPVLIGNCVERPNSNGVALVLSSRQCPNLDFWTRAPARLVGRERGVAAGKTRYQTG